MILWPMGCRFTARVGLALLVISSGCSSPPEPPADQLDTGAVDASGRTTEDTAARCTDGKDNDLDGFIDCQDQGCWGFNFCVDAGPEDQAADLQPADHRGPDAPAEDGPVVDLTVAVDQPPQPEMWGPDLPHPVDAPATDLHLPDAGGADLPPADIPGNDTAAADSGQPCATHHDCKQRWYCYLGSCTRDPLMAVYHCGKAGCLPGHWCVQKNGTKSTCSESSTHKCKDACDCGPAHCCKAGVCVKNLVDPRSPGGKTLGTARCEEGVDATYCCADPECHAGRFAYKENAEGFFRCHSRAKNQTVSQCGGDACHGTACNCKPGQSCVDTVSKAPPGKTCFLLTGGTCVSNGLAQTFYGFGAGDLLPCCKWGCPKGGKCEVGWRSDPRFAYVRVLGRCGSCGDGKCGDGEYPGTCSKDCFCGDGKCAPEEDQLGGTPPQQKKHCPADCGTCGDGKCQAPAETPFNCAKDCPKACGDGWCTWPETPGSCSKDCADRCVDAYMFPGKHAVCGDNFCSNTDCQDPESCKTCAQDCGACSKWTVVRRVPAWQRKTLRSVWGTSSSNVYVVGADGTLLRYDGGKWNPTLSGSPYGLYGVWGASTTSVYAVGAYGTILRHDGATWTLMQSNTSRSFTSVWGSSDTDVFAAGTNGTIQHYDGVKWRAMASGTTTTLWSVWGSSPTQVFAGGDYGTVRRYDGKLWSAINYSSSWWGVRGIWGSSGSEVFAVATSYSGLKMGYVLRWYPKLQKWLPMHVSGALTGIWGLSSTAMVVVGEKSIQRYDGKTWSKAQGIEDTMYGVWGSSVTDVYAVGKTGWILHHDGKAWSTKNFGRARMLTSIWGSSQTNLYLTSSLPAELMHFDGAQWSVAQHLPTVWVFNRNLLGVWGSSATDVYAVGYMDVLRYNGSAWASVAGVNNISPVDVWGTSASDVFIVGNGAFHYDGLKWREMNTNKAQALYAVWGSAPSDVHAVGKGGIMRRYDGVTWTTPTSPTAADLWGLWGSSSTDVFATGANGTILRHDGAGWKQTPASKIPTTRTLRAVWGRSWSDVHSVGDYGSVLHFDGAGWKRARTDLREVTSGSYACPVLWDVWGTSSGAVFAVGSSETVLRLCPGGKCP